MLDVPLVHEDPYDGRERLAELGLTVDDLHHAIRFGYLARLSCNANDPPAFVGIMFWGRTTRGLRERLAPLGWKKNDVKQSTVMNADETIAILVSTGDDATGIADGDPKSRFPKGPATKAAVTANGQGELFPLDQVTKRRPTTWVLLQNVARCEDQIVIRAELSRPSLMDEDGRIGGWFERIILPPNEDDDNGNTVRRDNREPGPDFDIDVRRRA
jgi:hypothetical protein